jgi:methylmalonyl-CoA mutase N-terminal domain/subunit
MYRGRPWTIRQFSGFGNARETNERYKYLIGQGGGGLSVAFDMPTLMGRDSDDPRSLGEVGHCGVAVDSVADMEILFDGLPLDELTTSMTISGPAPMLFAMYLVAAERQGAAVADLDGTLQTDIFKEYIAQKEWLFPPEPHLRLIGDLLEFCAAEVPRYHPVSVSGYHIREAGATAAQELAFTLADGFAYVELGERRDMQDILSRDRHRLIILANTKRPPFGGLVIGSERKARQAERSRPERPWGPARPRTQLADLRSATCNPLG